MKAAQHNAGTVAVNTRNEFTSYVALRPAKWAAKSFVQKNDICSKTIQIEKTKELVRSFVQKTNFSLDFTWEKKYMEEKLTFASSSLSLFFRRESTSKKSTNEINTKECSDEITMVGGEFFETVGSCCFLVGLVLMMLILGWCGMMMLLVDC